MASFSYIYFGMKHHVLISFFSLSQSGVGVDAKTEIQQWISFADNEILPAACTWVFPCMGIMAFNKQANERAKADLK